MCVLPPAQEILGSSSFQYSKVHASFVYLSRVTPFVCLPVFQVFNFILNFLWKRMFHPLRVHADVLHKSDLNCFMIAGPSGFFSITNLRRKDEPHIFKVMVDLSKKYGPIMGLRIGVRRIVCVSGYEAVKAALTNPVINGRVFTFDFALRLAPSSAE